MFLVIIGILVLCAMYFCVKTPPDQRVDVDKRGGIPPVPPFVRGPARQFGRAGLRSLRKPKRPPRSPYRLIRHGRASWTAS